MVHWYSGVCTIEENIFITYWEGKVSGEAEDWKGEMGKEKDSPIRTLCGSW